MAAVQPSGALAAVSAPSFSRAVAGATLPPRINRASPSPVAVGIDLGTKNSVIAALRGEKVDIIPVDGHRTTPSVVSYLPSGERLVGREAAAKQAVFPDRTIYDVKRLIGREYDERTLASDVKLLPYKVARHEGTGKIAIQLPDGKQIRAEEISAAILKKLKDAAEERLGGPVKKAVITVPAYFNHAQRESTKAAGEVAGLEVLRVINEPTAAAMAHGFGEGTKAEKSAGPTSRNVLVFDLGGGTFDVSLLSVNKDVMEVLATSGDTRLGGQDIDMALLRHMMKQFQREHGVSLEGNKKAVERLREACIAAKHDLSDRTSTKLRVQLDKLGLAGTAGKEFAKEVTRKELDSLARPILQRCLPPLDHVLRDAKVKKKQVNDVVLVGGVTRMPAVRKLVERYFSRKALSHKDVDPDEAVAVGAALQAAKLAGMGGATKDLLLLDVAPLTTGIETQGGYVTPIIERNTPIPARHTKLFTTTKDGQDTVDIRVLQGQRPRAKDNFLLGQFTLSGIPPTQRGVPKVSVTFDVDANGILKVTAEDQGTQAKNAITIQSSRSLTKDDVQRMVEEAKKHAAKDEQARKLREATDALRLLVERSKAAVASVKDKRAQETVAKSATEVERWLDERYRKLEDGKVKLSTNDVRAKRRWLEEQLSPVMKDLYKN